jgi:hypothetical protein
MHACAVDIRPSLTTRAPQFTSTASGDPQNAGVSWSVDGVAGGNTVVGTISSAGLFTPGTQARVHPVRATSNSNTSVSASATIAVSDITGMFTYRNDTARTGQNLQEYALTPITVNSSTFGALFTCPVDGYVYAAPLYVANLNIGGQTRNVVFIAKRAPRRLITFNPPRARAFPEDQTRTTREAE